MTECNRCGDCCETIVFGGTKSKLREWKQWWAKLTVDQRESAEPWQKRMVQDAVFILKHWHMNQRKSRYGNMTWTCDMFDPITRLCTAHDERPPVCSRFPWYDRPPSLKQANVAFSATKSCSFWNDVPRDEWPEGVRPVTIRTMRRRIAEGRHPVSTTV